jgi:hypothetical protein
LLVYLMRREGELEDRRAEIGFEEQVFLHSEAGNRPGLYFDWFDKSSDSDKAYEQGVEFFTPQDEDEVQDLLAAMRETGWTPG